MRTPFGGFLAGWELWLVRCGHLGPWLKYWLGNVSGEIYIDHPVATSGTAVAVTYRHISGCVDMYVIIYLDDRCII